MYSCGSRPPAGVRPAAPDLDDRPDPRSGLGSGASKSAKTRLGMCTQPRGRPKPMRSSDDGEGSFLRLRLGAEKAPKSGRVPGSSYRCHRWSQCLRRSGRCRAAWGSAPTALAATVLAPRAYPLAVKPRETTEESELETISAACFTSLRPTTSAGLNKTGSIAHPFLLPPWSLAHSSTLSSAIALPKDTQPFSHIQSLPACRPIQRHSSASRG